MKYRLVQIYPLCTVLMFGFVYTIVLIGLFGLEGPLPGQLLKGLLVGDAL